MKIYIVDENINVKFSSVAQPRIEDALASSSDVPHIQQNGGGRE